jgi:integrase
MNEITTTDDRALYAGLRDLHIKSYQTGHFNRFLDFIDTTGYGLADGLAPYVQHLKDNGWTDRNGKQHKYKAASIRIMVDAAKRLGDYVIEQNPDRFTPVMQLAWEKSKRTKGPQSDKAIDEDKFLPWGEVQALIQHTTDPKIRLIIAFLAQSACRINEALSVRLDDMTRNGVCYRILVHGKGSKDRKVAVEIPVVEEILAVFGSSQWLFEHNGQQFNPNSITTRISAWGRSVLNKGISAHTLRHSWTTEQMSQGRSLDEVSKYLGHSSISVTADIYSHVSLSSEKAMLPIFVVPSPEDEQAIEKALHEELQDIGI